jgi:hypothetical protein
MPQPDPEEFLEKHLTYNVLQLQHMLARISTTSDIAVNNAFIDAFSTYARALIEFLQGRDKSAAQDYVDGEWRGFPGLGEKIKRCIRRLNNQTSHLMQGRTDNDSGKIDHVERIEIYELIAAELRRFKAMVKPQYRHIQIPDLPDVSIVLPPEEIIFSGPSTSSVSRLVVSHGIIPPKKA